VESILPLLISDDAHGLDLDKPFRKKQLTEFIFQQLLFDFDGMTSLPVSLRDRLSGSYTVLPFEAVERQVSRDGTIKYLLRLLDGTCIEAVILTDRDGRHTFCISSQSGCRMGCAYCKTGSMGLLRNLEAHEIVGQVLFLAAQVQARYNVVYMGMGEPLDNYDAVAGSLTVLSDPGLCGISQSRITVSTCGVVDRMEPLLRRFPGIGLALSLNSAVQARRERIMPVTRRFPVSDLRDTVHRCYEATGRRVTLEYVMIDGFNLGDDEVEAIRQFDRSAVLLNLIPLNEAAEGYAPPDQAAIGEFSKKLKDAGFTVTRRYRRGDDIDAACGQLFYRVLHGDQDGRDAGLTD
jgi:23S rRNA (adenine2503-C2)-methyltransferase